MLAYTIIQSDTKQHVFFFNKPISFITIKTGLVLMSYVCMRCSIF